jgi:hypothetical protein
MSGQNKPPRQVNRLIWLLFFLPGKVILWLNYFFPDKGQVWTSARQKGNPVIEVLYSLTFWAVLAVLIWMIFFSTPNH